MWIRMVHKWTQDVVLGWWKMFQKLDCDCGCTTQEMYSACACTESKFYSKLVKPSGNWPMPASSVDSECGRIFWQKGRCWCGPRPSTSRLLVHRAGEQEGAQWSVCQHPDQFVKISITSQSDGPQMWHPEGTISNGECSIKEGKGTFSKRVYAIKCQNIRSLQLCSRLNRLRTQSNYTYYLTLNRVGQGQDVKWNSILVWQSWNTEVRWKCFHS